MMNGLSHQHVINIESITGTNLILQQSNVATDTTSISQVTDPVLPIILPSMMQIRAQRYQTNQRQTVTPVEAMEYQMPAVIKGLFPFLIEGIFVFYIEGTLIMFPNLKRVYKFTNL